MKKLLTLGIIMAILIMSLDSCQYKSIVEPVIPPPEPDDTISFSLEIEPIFTDNGCVACHPGLHMPDLTVGNAYNSIVSEGLINDSDPELSIIYTEPNPDGGHFAKYTSSQASLVLFWIEQGALDN
jgi:hypothetical protein